MALVFKKKIIRVMCAYGPMVGRSDSEKDQYNEMASEWDLQNPDEMILGLIDCSTHVGRWIDSFEGIHGRNAIGKRNVEKRRLVEFCDEKELHTANT